VRRLKRECKEKEEHQRVFANLLKVIACSIISFLTDLTLKGVLNPNFRPFSFELKKKN